MRHLMLIGDVRKALKTLPEKSIQTCVTSPPYWGLRDYGTPGQLGLEPTPEEYVANMVEVFREVKRVLRDDGTLWLNLGDCYITSPPGNKTPPKDLDGNYRRKQERQLGHGESKEAIYQKIKCSGLKQKDLVGQPWRVAFALQADGWYLRSDIIWHKPNPMPESVTDRPTKAHEYIFLLSKSEKYYYDADAIREPYNETTISRYKYQFNPDVASSKVTKNPAVGAGKIEPNPLGRNKRTVWTVATKPYSGSHFATFPPDLIRPCILAGTSPRACEVCGAPWERVVERKATGWDGRKYGENAVAASGGARTGGTAKSTLGSSNGKGTAVYDTTGWKPTCTCDNKGQAACTVLDPFGGSGTTTMMCEQLGRNSVYIDLNPEYVELAKERCGFGGKLIDTATYEIKPVGVLE